MPMGHRLRLGRVSVAGQFYVVTTRTHASEKIFANLIAGRIVVRELRALSASADTWAFVVMPDHVHWLFQLLEGPLSEVVRRFKGVSARRVNQLLDRNGPVWQRAYFDHAVRDDAAIIRHARYIVANPIRAGLVRHVGDYPLWDARWIAPEGAPTQPHRA